MVPCTWGAQVLDGKMKSGSRSGSVDVNSRTIQPSTRTKADENKRITIGLTENVCVSVASKQNDSIRPIPVHDFVRLNSCGFVSEGVFDRYSCGAEWRGILHDSISNSSLIDGLAPNISDVGFAKNKMPMKGMIERGRFTYILKAHSATAIQTVGSKGYDGFTMARVL
jgi:hypothetical protein